MSSPWDKKTISGSVLWWWLSWFLHWWWCSELFYLQWMCGTTEMIVAYSQVLMRPPLFISCHDVVQKVVIMMIIMYEECFLNSIFVLLHCSIILLILSPFFGHSLLSQFPNSLCTTKEEWAILFSWMIAWLL